MRQHSTSAGRLESLLGALVTPWEFASIDAWRDHVAVAARDAVEGQHSQVSLPAVCGLAPIRSPDVDPALIAEYQREWIARDLFADMLSRDGITTYVRSALCRRLPEFGAEYGASAIFNDFYERAGLHDAAGIMRRKPQHLQLTVFTTSRSNPRFVAQAKRVMPLAAPAFLAGARHILNVASIRGQFARNIDTIHAAVALFDTDGSRLHQNRALVHLLASLAGASELVALLDCAARALATILRGADIGMQLASATSGTMVWRWRDLEISGSLARLGIDGSQPLVMLQVYGAGQDATPATARVSASDASGLTLREREVGLLLARGVKNRAIAKRLGVSEHTARRHTERVLRKLGVTSRASVAAALGLIRDDSMTGT